MFSCFLSLFVSVPVPDAYVNVLSIIVFFSLNFSFFHMFLFLKTSMELLNEPTSFVLVLGLFANILTLNALV